MKLKKSLTQEKIKDYESLINRLDINIDHSSDCWNVTSHNNYQRDYPTVWHDGKHHSIHRLIYSFYYGYIPNGFIIRHSCDNTKCINPVHLIIGTKKDNTQDMLERGRESRWKGGRSQHLGNKRRKLSDKDIIKIRESDMSSYELAEIYPVSSTHIRRIRNGSRCVSID